MRNNTNPAWLGGARQKVSFWSNGSADNKDLISNTQACLCRHDGGQPRRVITALSPGNAWVPLRDRRDDPLRPQFIGDVVLERVRMTPNVVQRGDGLTLLRSLPDGCTPVVFFDSQHRTVLDNCSTATKVNAKRGALACRRWRIRTSTHACCREAARLMHRAGWQGRRASSGMAFAWFDWDSNHRRPLARHLPQYYRRRQRRLGTGISATTTAVTEAVITASAIAIELLKAAS